MGMKQLLVVLACGLAACTVESTPDDSDPVDKPKTKEEIPTEPTLPVAEPPATPQLEGAISDAIIAGDPTWPVESWTRLQVGDAAPTLEGLLGKVVVILCFQHW